MNHLRSNTSGLPETRIAFVQGSGHKEIVDQCREAFTEEMMRGGYAQSSLDFFVVAGAFEIPLQAKLLAKTGRYSAVVAAGLVVDGGIYRHEFVAQSVIGGLMQVQLETEVPMISAVLTPHHFHSHDEHQQYFSRHFLLKGTEAAQACISTVAALRRLAQFDAEAEPRPAALACA
jgi:6,7-dimethyl-8-ribityllumazine synthase